MCSLFWRVDFTREWNWSEFGVSGCVVRSFWGGLWDRSEIPSDPWGRSWAGEGLTCSLRIHYKFALILLFLRIRSLEGGRVHSFLFGEYNDIIIIPILWHYWIIIQCFHFERTLVNSGKLKIPGNSGRSKNI